MNRRTGVRAPGDQVLFHHFVISFLCVPFRGIYEIKLVVAIKRLLF